MSQCAAALCSPIGQTGFHSKLNCQTEKTPAPLAMNEIVEYETDCLTPKKDRTAGRSHLKFREWIWLTL
jgi:hypothetical protein